MKLGPLKDKRVQIGVAVAAALGLIALLRRGGGEVSGGGGGEQTITPANYDSSGVDGYNAISQIGAAWGAEFEKYNGQLEKITDQLGKIQTPVKPAAPAGYGWYKVKKGDSLAGIAKKAGISLADLKKYNSANSLNRLSPNEYVRVRYASGSKPG